MELFGFFYVCIGMGLSIFPFVVEGQVVIILCERIRSILYFYVE